MTTHVDLWPVAQLDDARFISRVLHIVMDASVLDQGDNWLADALDDAATYEQWNRDHWIFILDQLCLMKAEYVPGAIFWRRAINRAKERIIPLLEKEA